MKATSVLLDGGGKQVEASWAGGVFTDTVTYGNCSLLLLQR